MTGRPAVACAVARGSRRRRTGTGQPNDDSTAKLGQTGPELTAPVTSQEGDRSPAVWRRGPAGRARRPNLSRILGRVYGSLAIGADLLDRRQPRPGWPAPGAVGRAQGSTGSPEGRQGRGRVTVGPDPAVRPGRPSGDARWLPLMTSRCAARRVGRYISLICS